MAGTIRPLKSSTISLLRLRSIIGAGVALSALALGIWYGAARRPVPPTVVGVGVDDSPPVYTFGPDGKVSGLAVDILNEAARRKNIRLEWHPSQDIPLDQMLSSRRVQM